MWLFKKKEKKEDGNNNSRKNNETSSHSIKCKKCGMSFEGKERLKVHDKKAHSGRGERKKKTP
jgi:hypothetical protein